MCNIRQGKVNRVSEFIPEQEIYIDDSGDLLIVGWEAPWSLIFCG